MLDLLPLSLGFWQRPVVRYFHHDPRDPLPKAFSDLFASDADILDRVVQNGRDQDIYVVDTANICQQVCDLERMIYIRFLVVAFSMVAGMTNSGKARRLKKFI